MLFDVQSTDAATLALADGTPLLSYFSPPITNETLVSSAILQTLSDSSLETCGRACLSDRACLSFVFSVFSSNCELYLVAVTEDNTVTTEGAVLYQKLQDRVNYIILLA